MKQFAKYLPIVITLVGVFSTYLSPAVNAFWSSHPETVASIAGVWATIKWLLPPPIKGQ